MNLTSQNLPHPSDEEIALSNQLKNHLIGLIKESEQQGISFSTYMNETLFSNWGYYKNGAEKFGLKGDFITAPEISPIFAKCLASPIEKAFQVLNSRIIVEFGSGSGALMLALLKHFAEQNQPIEKYYLLDISADLRARQERLIKEEAPEFLDSIIWLSSLNLAEKINAVVLANEVLDTFGFDCFIQSEKNKDAAQLNLSSTKEKKVGLDENNNFCFKTFPLQAKQKKVLRELNQSLSSNAHHPNQEFFQFEAGYQSEIPIDYSPWLKTIQSSFNHAIGFLIDYGLTDFEYYSPEKNQGTLRCYYRHLLHSEPFHYPGISDITAHVNFSKLLRDAKKNEIECIHFTTQGQFLLNGDIETILSGAESVEEQMKLTSDFKKLVLPTEMGEIFKVMVLNFNPRQTKCEDLEFTSRDLSHQL